MDSTRQPGLGFALGPGRVVVSDDPGADLAEICAGLGASVAVVVGEQGVAALTSVHPDWCVPGAEVRSISGQVTQARALELAQWAKDFDVLVGVGGGKVMDTVKAVGAAADVPVVTVPTSAATCACAANLCVIYRADGAFSHNQWVNSVAALLIPRRVMAGAPTRLLVSGIFDAVAKLPELEWQLGTKLTTPGALIWPAQLSRQVATTIHTTLGEHLVRLRDDPATPADDEVILANTVGAAIVTGTQPPTHLGVGHALYYEHRSWDRDPRLLHGEVVGVGLVPQLVLNGATADQVAKFRTLLAGAGLPTVVDEQITPRLDEQFITQWAARCHADPAKLAAALKS